MKFVLAFPVLLGCNIRNIYPCFCLTPLIISRRGRYIVRCPIFVRFFNDIVRTFSLAKF